MKIFIIICFLFVSLGEVFSQEDENKKGIPFYNMRDSSVFYILNDLISEEMSCDYFSDTLAFSLDILKLSSKDDSSIIVIQSSNDINVLFRLEPVGFFQIRNHRIFLYGDDIDLIFSNSNSHNAYYYTPLCKESQDVRLLVAHNDSYSSWLFIFSKDVYTLFQESRACE